MRVRLHILAITTAVSVLWGGVAVLRAQGLGDVARQEEARRKEIKGSGKVYTNKDLVPVPPPSTPSPDATSGASQATEGTGRDTADSAGKDQDAKDSAKGKTAVRDQAYWSGRLKELTSQLDRDQTYADALESRIGALTRDFTARDDPAQRGVLARDRQKNLDELDRLKKAVQSDKKAIADFQEDARRAAVPPGWLR